MIFVATPFTRPHWSGYLKSLLATEWFGPFEYKDLPNMPIDIGREFLVDCFLLDPNNKFLLFIDNDATWHPQAVRRLFDHNVPIVSGCMYAVADLKPTPTMAEYAGRSEDGHDYYKFAPVVREVVDYVRKETGDKDLPNNACLIGEPGLREVDGVGMHFTMIRRDVFEYLPKPWFKNLGTSGAGEDFYFCKKARKAGFPIYYDISVHTGHIVGEKMDVGIKNLKWITKYLPIEELVSEEEVWEMGGS